MWLTDLVFCWGSIANPKILGLQVIGCCCITLRPYQTEEKGVACSKLKVTGDVIHTVRAKAEIPGEIWIGFWNI